MRKAAFKVSTEKAVVHMSDYYLVELFNIIQCNQNFHMRFMCLHSFFPCVSAKYAP